MYQIFMEVFIMKKIIALIITVMMLASTLVVGVAAYRESDAELVTRAVTNKVLDTSVSDGVYLYLGGLDFAAGDSAEFDMEFARDAGTYSDGWGLNWPCLHKDKIGVGNEMINYSFSLNTVYKIKFVVGDGSTEIFVNGISIGSVAKALSGFGCGVEGIKFDNFVLSVGGDTKTQDFEGYDDGYDAVGNGRWYFSDGNAGASEIVESEVINHNKYLDTSVGDGTYIYCSDINFGAGSNVYFDLAFADLTLGTYSDGWGLSWLNLHGDKIGVGGSTIAYAFEANRFYKVRMAVGSGSTEIFIDGTSIGTVSAQLDKFACGVEGVLFDNIVVVKEGKVYNTDFEGYDANYDVVGNSRWYFSDGTAGASCITEVTKAETVDEIVVNYNNNVYHQTVHHAAVTDGKALYFANEGKWPDGSSRDGAAYLYTNNLFDPSNEGKSIMTVDLCALDTNAYLNVYIKAGVTFDFGQQTIGVGNVNIPLDTPWQVGEWHTVTVYSSFGDVGSVIMVDGALLSASGSVSAGANAKFGAAWCGGATNMGIDNIKIYTGDQFTVGDLLYSEDFEDGAMTGINGDCNGVILDKVVTPAYDENIDGSYELNRYYWTWDPDNCYAYVNGLNDKAARWEFDAKLAATTDHMGAYFGYDPILKVMKEEDVKFAAAGAHGHFADESPVNGVTDDFTMRVVLKSSTDYFENANLGEMVGWLDGSPLISMKDDTISFVGAPSTLSYDFQDDTLYTIDFVVDGDTTVYVNGAEVGTIGKNMRAIVYGVFYRYLVNEVSFIQNGSVFGGFDADDLSGTCGWLADADIVTDGTKNVIPGAIGVGGTTLPYNFVKDTWYHIVLDGSAGNGTDIYVDGLKVGSVATTIKAQWCGHPSELAIDNLAITADGVDYFEDFEDQSFGAYDGNGYAIAYEFDIVPPEPVKDIYEFITTGTPGGEAYLVKGGYDYELGFMGADNYNAYYDMDTAINPGREEYVINFDLALIPETDTTGATYFEIWSQVATNRWVVGTTQTGYYNGSENTSDYTAFDWGEATKDNFHNVTYIFRARKCTILVDGVEVYEGRSGTVWTNMMIGNVYNGSAILDNVQLFKFTDSNPKQPNELEALTVRMANDEDVKVIDLDAADFCAANGHIQGYTVRTTAPLCEATGVDTTYCAICGAAAKTTVVPAIGHSWPNYYNGAHKEDGYWYWECKNGCGTTKQTTVPTPVEGSYDLFLDFADAEVVQGIADIFNGDGEVVADGVGKFTVGCGQNYNQFDIRGALRNQYTISFDFKVNSLFDSNDTNSYGHGVWFWFGGDSGIGNEAGYDFDAGEFFVRPWNSTAYGEIRAAAKISKDTWHHLEFRVYAPGEQSDDNWMKFILDGEEVLVFDDWYSTAYYLPTQQGFCIIRDFGVAADIDNFAIGTYDLALEAKRNVGDLTGDTLITTKDLKVMKLALAGKIVLTAAEEAAADINGDGLFTIADLGAMKRLLAGA